MSDVPIPESRLQVFMNGYSGKYLGYGYQGVVQLFIMYYHGNEGVPIVTEHDHCTDAHNLSIAKHAKQISMAQNINEPMDIIEYFQNESPSKREFCQFTKKYYDKISAGVAVKTYRRLCNEEIDFEGEYIQGFYAWNLQKNTNTINTDKVEMEKKYDVMAFTANGIYIDDEFMSIFNDYWMMYYWFNTNSKQYINKETGEFIVAVININYESRNNDNNILYGIVFDDKLEEKHDKYAYKVKTLMTEQEINEQFGINAADLPQNVY